MLEVTGGDVEKLTDTDLRTLVARLAIAELRAQGCPISAVTAGGNQDAPDGGLDVRVDCPKPLPSADFVPRPICGFQVKKPDMPAGAIRKEMRPNNVLRPVIAELAVASGAYIIVSAQGSVSARRLADRCAAIRNQLHDLPNSSNLTTDFYDRDRLATWINQYPGITAWVREQLERGLSGWSSIYDWHGAAAAKSPPYLFDQTTCLIDERTSDPEHLTIDQGIESIREVLRKPGQCVRLIGLSGVGKTRLVHALFEDGVGQAPLDPSSALYTDYSQETVPSARDMARQLVIQQQTAILIVDNCNPTTHTELAHICSASGSKASLITIEYDVRDDEPERTHVFRLQSASLRLVEQWLEQTFPNVTLTDRSTISRFSDGNFRVARALAETVGKGKTLGNLKSRDLFDRIFQQRNEPDSSLLSTARALALLYSIDGENTSPEGELAFVARLRHVPIQTLYEALATLRQRGIAQGRGRWRAILPHAIANHLASAALESIPPSDMDQFAASISPRMQRSFSRRLGYLHESSAVIAMVKRWLRPDGPLHNLLARGEDGLQIISNIAPAAPEAVLDRIKYEIDDLARDVALRPYSDEKFRWVRLLKSLAYDPATFDDAATLLSRFAALETGKTRDNEARRVFAELFHLSLSGTKALPEQRRKLVRKFASSGEPRLMVCAEIALVALLKGSHFSSSDNFDFGSRSRNWGWRPETYGDVWSWRNAAIDLAVELSPLIPTVRAHLASVARELWRVPACRAALERAATSFLAERPWIEGWISLRAMLNVQSHNMAEDDQKRLALLVTRLKPADLLNQARAMIFVPGITWDVADDLLDNTSIKTRLDSASTGAKKIGARLARDPNVRDTFLRELVIAQHAPNAFECGTGLAEGTDDLEAIWQELVESDFISSQHGMKTLGGFILGAHLRDAPFAENALNSLISSPSLAKKLPTLQAYVAIDVDGIARLRRAIGEGTVTSSDCYGIANGNVRDAPPAEFEMLLRDIARLSEGGKTALNILHLYFRTINEVQLHRVPNLIKLGCQLLCSLSFSESEIRRSTSIRELIRICFSEKGEETAFRAMCGQIRAALAVSDFSEDFAAVLQAVFKANPLIALDEFLLSELMDDDICVLDAELGLGAQIQALKASLLLGWAQLDPHRRFQRLGQAVSFFTPREVEDGNAISPLFMELLSHAPDRCAFLGDIESRVRPWRWRGSMVEALVQRRSAINQLEIPLDQGVSQWVQKALREMDQWIEIERGREQIAEQSFE
ncbi:hypothetical protein [Gluconobacter oxydans]|uniref:hypothetical protein n=1 Tax=Gluconobacter oxydans TaxID=442 RepID=UPI0039EB49C5